MSGDGWFRVIADIFGWMVFDGFEWFWVLADRFGWIWWFSEICSFRSYGEIRCFKFKRSRQLCKVFVVSSNNDAKVPLKQMTKFFGNSKYKVSLKKTLGEYEKFFLVIIDIYSFI